jgi:hypothetical protein
MVFTRHYLCDGPTDIHMHDRVRFFIVADVAGPGQAELAQNIRTPTANLPRFQHNAVVATTHPRYL